MSYQYTFTVFTSAYNRAYILHRVYESLKKQTFRDFEWLIVDNGSTDNVKELVQQWQKEADFPIHFFSWKKNVWWHGAYNRGVQEAKGELFFNFDSDDTCFPTMLEVLKKYWDLIPEDSKDQFSALTCLCVDQHGNLVGNKFPQDITDSDSLEIKYKYKVKGEKKGFHRTRVLKEFPFPQFDGLYPPSIIWHRIAKKYKTRFINQPLVTWFVNEEGRTDQWTFHTHIKRGAKGLTLMHGDVLNNHIDWFRYSPFEFFRSAVHFIRFSLHCKTGINDQMKEITNFPAKLIWFLMLPVGVLVFLKDPR